MKIMNRQFNRDYSAIEKFEAGIVLTGAEVKSIKAGHIRLENAFIKLLGPEAFLVNAEVTVFPYARPAGYDPRRTRKLLLHKKELLRLRVKLSTSSRLTIAPFSCYNKGGLVKLEIALAKGKGEIEKKNLDKKRDIVRDQQREAKEYMKE